jgi:hypothetical protein
MSESNSTTSVSSDKPAKPYPDFPLFAHATKRWAERTLGKKFYSGRWDDALPEHEVFLSGK